VCCFSGKRREANGSNAGGAGQPFNIRTRLYQNGELKTSLPTSSKKTQHVQMSSICVTPNGFLNERSSYFDFEIKLEKDESLIVNAEETAAKENQDGANKFEEKEKARKKLPHIVYV
jgi:hypothetical protein